MKESEGIIHLVDSSDAESEPAPADGACDGGGSEDGGHSKPAGIGPEAPAGDDTASAEEGEDRPPSSPGLRMLAEAAHEAATAGPSNGKKPSKAQHKAGRKKPVAAGSHQYLRPHAMMLARGEQMDLQLQEKRALLGLQVWRCTVVMLGYYIRFAHCLSC